MIARKPQPPPKSNKNDSPRNRPPPPARDNNNGNDANANPKLVGKLGQRYSGFAAGLDPTKLKPGAAPPPKKMPAHFAAIGIDPNNPAGLDSDSKVENAEVNASAAAAAKPVVAGGRKRKSRKNKAAVCVFVSSFVLCFLFACLVL